MRPGFNSRQRNNFLQPFSILHFFGLYLLAEWFNRTFHILEMGIFQNQKNFLSGYTNHKTGANQNQLYFQTKYPIFRTTANQQKLRDIEDRVVPGSVQKFHHTILHFSRYFCIQVKMRSSTMEPITPEVVHSGDGDAGEGGGTSKSETRGQIVQRHKRELRVRSFANGCAVL